MANETTLTVIGNLTADPQYKVTTSGTALARFTVASTPRRYDKTASEWVNGDTLFMAVTAWRQLADNTVESLKQGMRVIVIGRLRESTWETPDGDKRSRIELTADDIGPALTGATATVNKTTRRTETTNSGAPDPWASTAPTSNDEPPL